MEWQSFRERLHETVAAGQRMGMKNTFLEIAEPALPSEVEEVEKALGRALPGAFRNTLLEFSSAVTMYWFLREEMKPPFPGIFSGMCRWSLARLPELEKSRRDWISTCFSNAGKSYNKVWHRVLSFAEVGNGDVLAIDPDSPGEPVVFVSHDGSNIHGWHLGNDFIDYLDRSSRLAFVGAEDWQLNPFLSSPHAGLQVNSSQAKLWQQWVGLAT